MTRFAIRTLIGVLLLARCALADEFPLIKTIDFEGNDTTQPKVMLREMKLHVGDAADPAAIERDRQAILDLGLFRWVSIHQERTEGGVHLVVSVREKYYILPYPRLSGNTDLQYGYGAELRWNNIGGLNQSLRTLVSRSNLKREGYGLQTTYLADYYAPFVFDSRYNLELTGEHMLAPVTGTTSYNETFDYGQVLVTRNFGGRSASQGWTVGGGVLWQNEDRWGEQAPPPYGMATALVGVASYRDVRFMVYSEEGVAYGTRVEGALKDIGSDYNYSSITAYWTRYLHVGEKPHQSLYLQADTGYFFNGPEINGGHFSLGGSSALHGYKKFTFQGDAYYHLAATFLRPVGWDWFRPEVVLEAGNVFDEARDASLDEIHWSLGLGARLRVSWFVNFEMEAGVAMPIGSGKHVRFFGGKV